MEELMTVRTRLRTKATKLSNDLRTYRQGDPKSLDQDQLALKIHHVEQTLEELRNIQTQLDKLKQPDDSSHVQTLEDEHFLGSRLLARLERAEEASVKVDRSPTVNLDLKSSLSVKLPTFNGDMMKWSEFWEMFDVSVHDNPKVADVQKFVILKSHLAGAALRAIQGIPVSASGYKEAVTLLKERFELNDECREKLMKDLVNMPSVQSDDLKAMRSLIDHLAARTRALSSLGVTADSFSSLLLPIVKEKIPENWRVEWARQKGSDFSQFLTFLQQEIRVRESARGTASDTSSKPHSAVPAVCSNLNARREYHSDYARPSKQTKTASCGVCGKSGHGLDGCEKLKRMSMDARWKAIKAAKACFRCLIIGHRVRDCRAASCAECGRNHHPLLHYPASSTNALHEGVTKNKLSAEAPPFSPSPPTAQASTSGAGSQASSGHHRYNISGECGQGCFFQTALVKAEGPKGQRLVRILLDGGSDSSYIRSSLAEELGLNITGTGTFSCVGFQEKTEEPRQYDRVRVDLESRFGDGPVSLDMWSTTQLCSPLPATSPPKVPSALPDLMADDFKGGEVDILIGIDNLYHVVLWDQVDLGDGLRAIDTVFGYVVHGRHGDGSPDQPCRRANHRCQVERMWDLDTVGISGKEAPDSVSAQKSQPQWNKEEGRYEMGLVWRSDDRPVANLEATRIRTRRMAGKLTEEKIRMYDDQIKEMLSTSVIEEVPAADTSHRLERSQVKELVNEHALVPVPADEEVKDSERSVVDDEVAAQNGMRPPMSMSTTASDEDVPTGFFLPHRGVFRKEKLRIVFDGSAKDGAGKSLNDYLEPGDNLLLKLPAVVLTFRDGAVACQSDIKAAFHQVVVKSEDRQYLQFFWSDLQLRFARVPFGIACAPFMLLKTIDTHLGTYEVSDPELCSKIRAGTYMDDICTTFHTRKEAEKKMGRMEEMFGAANMQLHKSRVSGDSMPDSGVLGMIWSTETDQLAVVVPDLKCPTTKRELLSTVSRTFDPLGALAPWLIGGKAMFQRLWKEFPSVKWDDPMPEDLQKEVRAWWRNSSDYRIWFPRALASAQPEPEDGVFHVFCDASRQAYCAVVYVVTGRESRLVMAKSRLAPLSPNLTIPRLELMAAFVGVRLMNFIKETLKLDNPTVTFWTDSTDVLYWLWNRKSRKVFVENRVSAILDMSHPQQWKHVKGAENPADLGTRGISLAAVARSEVWWVGPPHILGMLPIVEHEVAELQLSSEAQREDKAEKSQKVAATARTVASPTTGNCLFDITGCSSLKQVVSRTAWIKRFVFNARHMRTERRSGPLTPEESRQALEFWIRKAQENAYHSELSSIKKGDLLPEGSPLTKLRPQLRDDGVLCAIPRTHEPPCRFCPSSRTSPC